VNQKQTDAVATVVAGGAVSALVMIGIPVLMMGIYGLGALVVTPLIYVCAWMLASVGLAAHGLTFWQSYVCAFVLCVVSGFFKVSGMAKP
jgi:hypothetical protein